MLCEVLGVARSSYYHWRARREREPSERERKNAELLEKIKGVFEKNKGRYGSPRIHAELKKKQVACSLGRVKRLRTRPNGPGFARSIAARRALRCEPQETPRYV